jgi:hypothetical protein
MRGDLKEELSNRLPWLFDDLGFRIREHDFSYKHMGSLFVVLESGSLRVQFVNDRGSIVVQVASLSEPLRWMDLGFLWLSLTGDRPSPELEGWAWFLRDHVAQIAEALGPDFEKTKAAFDQREKESQETAERYLSPFRQDARRARFRTFLMGPLGWIVAAFLLIWAAAR